MGLGLRPANATILLSSSLNPRADEGALAGLLLNLTVALKNHTRALLDTQAQNGDREGELG